MLWNRITAIVLRWGFGYGKPGRKLGDKTFAVISFLFEPSIDFLREVNTRCGKNELQCQREMDLNVLACDLEQLLNLSNPHFSYL